MNAYRYIHKRLLKEANRKLSILSRSTPFIDIESDVEKAKQLGFEAVCHLLNENIGRRGHLKSLKSRLGDQIRMLDNLLRQDYVTQVEAVEARNLANEFRRWYNEASILLSKYEEFVQCILEKAWYEAEVARSATKEELEERIASYQRVLDHSNKEDHQETMNQAAILIPLYKEALSKLDNDR